MPCSIFPEYGFGKDNIPEGTIDFFEQMFKITRRYFLVDDLRVHFLKIVRERTTEMIRMSSTRDKLIEATLNLLRTHGLARVTTRKIAHEAGVAEGALYHYFSDKAELIDAVVQHSMGDFREVMDSLPSQVGQLTVRENLEETLQAAFEFQKRIVPIICSLFADHKLLARIREIMKERRINPRRSVEILAAYLKAEQELGRVGAEVAPYAAAELLFSRSFSAAFFDHFLGLEMSVDGIDQRLGDAVSTILTGIQQRIPQGHSLGTQE
jgi:AcrR family transcriptional regulator